MSGSEDKALRPEYGVPALAGETMKLAGRPGFLNDWPAKAGTPYSEQTSLPSSLNHGKGF
jgi:hypothetical protein